MYSKVLSIAQYNPTYGTSLPGSPLDGAVHVLVDSTTAPTYRWTLRYNAGSGSSYKWEFLGGTPKHDRINTSENSTSNTYVDITTVGPQWTTTNAGDWKLEYGAFMFTAAGAGSNQAYASPYVGTTPSDDDCLFCYTGASRDTAGSYARQSIFTSVAASTLIKLQYKYGGNSPANFRYRWLSITPVRIS